MSMEKIRIMVSCQIQGCAEEVSYELDMVRLWKDKPICQNCWECGGGDTSPAWWDLPSIGLEHLGGLPTPPPEEVT